MVAACMSGLAGGILLALFVKFGCKEPPCRQHLRRQPRRNRRRGGGGGRWLPYELLPNGVQDPEDEQLHDARVQDPDHNYMYDELSDEDQIDDPDSTEAEDSPNEINEDSDDDDELELLDLRNMEQVLDREQQQATLALEATTL